MIIKIHENVARAVSAGYLYIKYIYIHIYSIYACKRRKL